MVYLFWCLTAFTWTSHVHLRFNCLKVRLSSSSYSPSLLLIMCTYLFSEWHAVAQATCNHMSHLMTEFCQCRAINNFSPSLSLCPPYLWFNNIEILSVNSSSYFLFHPSLVPVSLLPRTLSFPLLLDHYSSVRSHLFCETSCLDYVPFYTPLRFPKLSLS